MRSDARPPRIMFLTRSLGFGGAERQLVELARALGACGWQVTVAEFYGPGPLAADLQGSGVMVRSLEKRGRWDLAGFSRSLTSLVREVAPDVLHSYLVEPNIVSALLKLRMPSLKVVWGVRASNMEFSRYGVVSSASFATTVALSRMPDLIIANSHAGAQFHVSRGYPASRMRVVPNGIDSVRFHPDADARCQERAALSADAGTLLLGVMGRLDVMKDHPTFLRAAATFAAGHVQARFLVIGSGSAPYVATMRDLAASLGIADRVHWLDSRHDAQRVLNACDMVVSASAFGEGFPNVVGEAMSCGVPCVVTDVGDSARVVGDEGIVVPPSDPAALAAGMTSLATRLGPELSARCRERIVSQFSIQRLAENTMDVLGPLSGVPQ